MSTLHTLLPPSLGFLLCFGGFLPPRPPPGGLGQLTLLPNYSNTGFSGLLSFANSPQVVAGGFLLLSLLLLGCGGSIFFFNGVQLCHWEEALALQEPKLARKPSLFTSEMPA